MKHMIAIVGAALLAAAPATAASVDFESVPTGYTANPIVVGDLTFSSSDQLYVGPYNTQQICATNGSTCALDLTVLFSSAASGISFTNYGDDSSTAMLDVLLNFFGGSSTTVSFTLDGNFDNDLIDLAGYSNVLSMVLSTNDPGGLTYDNFSYTLAAAVPEPATWAMMLLGFGFVGAAMRRRRTQGHLQVA